MNEYMHFTEGRPEEVTLTLNKLSAFGWKLITITSIAHSTNSPREYTAFLERAVGLS